MERKATAVWNGDLKSGNGKLTAPSGVLKEIDYTFATRFESRIHCAVETLGGSTVITSTTTFLATLGLFFFGPEVIQSFVQAMLFGIIVGVYSSAFIAAPLLIYLGVTTYGTETETSSEAKARA